MHKKIISAVIGFAIVLAIGISLLTGQKDTFAWSTNEDRLDQDFWDNDWSSGNDTLIKTALYGDGIGLTDKTRYSKYWTQNICDPNTMSVVHINSGTNNIPDILTANTIYVLEAGSHIKTGTVTMPDDCTAIVGQRTTAYVTGAILQFSGNFATGLFIDDATNVIVGQIWFQPPIFGGNTIGTAIHAKNIDSSTIYVSEVRYYYNQGVFIDGGSNIYYNVGSNYVNPYGTIISGVNDIMVGESTGQQFFNIIQNQTGLFINNSQNVQLYGDTSYNYKAGVHIQNSSGVVFNGRYYSNNYGNGVLIEDSTGITFNKWQSNNPAFSANIGYGLYMRNVSGITGNGLFAINNTGGTGYGVYLDGVSNMTVSNIVTSANTRDGVFVTGSQNIALNNITSTGNGSNGLQSANTLSMTLSGGLMSGNQNNGIYIGDYSSNITLTNTKTSFNDRNGIEFSASSGFTVNNYISSGNEESGIHIGLSFSGLVTSGVVYQNGVGVSIGQGSTGNIINNTIAYRNAGGFAIQGRDTQYNVIKNSVAYENSNMGFYLASTINNSLSSIHAYDNSLQGILLHNSESNTVEHAVTNNNAIGLEINGASIYNNLYDISSFSNGQQGLYIFKSDSNQVKYIWLYDNNIGLQIKEGKQNTFDNILSYDNTNAGIFIDGKGSNRNAINNFALFNNIYGLTIQDTAMGDAIQDNTFNNGALFNNIYGLHMQYSFGPVPIQQNIFNDLNIYNNDRGVYVTGGSVINNTYYGDLNLAGNIVDLYGTDATDGVLDAGPFSLLRLGWNPGSLTTVTGFIMTCNRAIQATNTITSNLLSYPYCDTKGPQSWTGSANVRYTFFPEIIKQSQPVVYDNLQLLSTSGTFEPVMFVGDYVWSGSNPFGGHVTLDESSQFTYGSGGFTYRNTLGPVDIVMTGNTGAATYMVTGVANSNWDGLSSQIGRNGGYPFPITHTNFNFIQNAGGVSFIRVAYQDDQNTSNYYGLIRGVASNDDISITKIASTGVVFPGDQIGFTITVTNSGSDSAGISQVIDFIPSGIDPIGLTASPIGTYTGDLHAYIWDLPVVSGNTSYIFTITGIVSSNITDNQIINSGYFVSDQTSNGPDWIIYDEVSVDVLLPINGGCGTAQTNSHYGQSTLTSLTIDLCGQGGVSGFVGPDLSGSYTWTCLGVNNGSDALCTADENRCGDTIVDTNNAEQCDLGGANGNGVSGCSATCEYVTPSCTLTADPLTGNAPLTIRFTGILTNGALFSSISYGDSSFGVSAISTHTYTTGGIFTGTMTVVNPLTGGVSAQCTVSILSTMLYCGDGNIDTPNGNGFVEQCDEGVNNGNGIVGCNAQCEIETFCDVPLQPGFEITNHQTVPYMSGGVPNGYILSDIEFTSTTVSTNPIVTYQWDIYSSGDFFGGAIQSPYIFDNNLIVAGQGTPTVQLDFAQYTMDASRPFIWIRLTVTDSMGYQAEYDTPLFRDHDNGGLYWIQGDTVVDGFFNGFILDITGAMLSSSTSGSIIPSDMSFRPDMGPFTGVVGIDRENDGINEEFFVYPGPYSYANIYTTGVHTLNLNTSFGNLQNNYQLSHRTYPVACGVSCGNGITEGIEQCDEGVNNGLICDPNGQSCSYCSNSCQSVTVDAPYCGDGNTDSLLIGATNGIINHVIYGDILAKTGNEVYNFMGYQTGMLFTFEADINTGTIVSYQWILSGSDSMNPGVTGFVIGSSTSPSIDIFSNAFGQIGANREGLLTLIMIDAYGNVIEVQGYITAYLDGMTIVYPSINNISIAGSTVTYSDYQLHIAGSTGLFPPTSFVENATTGWQFLFNNGGWAGYDWDNNGPYDYTQQGIGQVVQHNYNATGQYITTDTTFFFSGFSMNMPVLIGDLHKTYTYHTTAGITGSLYEESCDDGNTDDFDGCDTQCLPNTCNTTVVNTIDLDVVYTGIQGVLSGSTGYAVLDIYTTYTGSNPVYSRSAQSVLSGGIVNYLFSGSTTGSGIQLMLDTTVNSGLSAVLLTIYVVDGGLTGQLQALVQCTPQSGTCLVSYIDQTIYSVQGFTAFVYSEGVIYADNGPGAGTVVVTGSIGSQTISLDSGSNTDYIVYDTPFQTNWPSFNQTVSGSFSHTLGLQYYNSCTIVCGDGIPEGSEQCDDGNLTGNDGCSTSCLLENPSCNRFTTTAQTGNAPHNFTISVLPNIYTGGYIFNQIQWMVGVVGSDVGDVFTDNTYTYTGVGSYIARVTVSRPAGMQAQVGSSLNCSWPVDVLSTCGNDILEQGEECDGSAVLPGYLCSEDCTDQIYYCDTIDDSLFVSSGYVPHGVSLSFIDPSYATIRSNIGLIYRGDGSTGNILSDNTYTYTLPGQYTGSITLSYPTGPKLSTTSRKCDFPVTIIDSIPICGNDIIEQGETCDDGNTSNGDGCTASCIEELDCSWFSLDYATGTAPHEVTVSFDSGVDASPYIFDIILRYEVPLGYTGAVVYSPYIFNGTVRSDVPSPFSTGHIVTSPSYTYTIPGQYKVKVPITYADPNYTGYNFCEFVVDIEDSVQDPICGNQILEGNEQCDDGNTNNNDGCGSQCVFEIPQTCGLSGNLVPNPGFESYIQCPTDFSHFTGYAASWYSPSPNADYMLMGCPFGSGIFNAIGQSPHGGSSGAVHILTYASNIPGAGREYIAAQLLTPMQIGKRYNVGFCYATTPMSNYISDKIGMLFSTGSYPTNAFWSAITEAPQFEHTGYIVGTGWTCVSGTVLADKAYERFTIGSFHTNSGQSMIPNPIWNSGVQVPGYQIASYIIDDVFVSEECSSSPAPYCGDNIKNGNEECDGGNECRANCTKPSGGGGGGSSVLTDYCPAGDFSSSYYDKQCGAVPVHSAAPVGKFCMYDDEEYLARGSFDDIFGHWGELPIEVMRVSCLHRGRHTKAGLRRYEPNANIQRDEVLKTLVKIVGVEFEDFTIKSEELLYNGAIPFVDVSNKNRFSHYATYAFTKGLTEGLYTTDTSKKYISPTKNMTRYEATKAIVIAYEKIHGTIVTQGATLSKITDVSATDPNYNYVRKAEVAGLVQGYPQKNGTFVFNGKGSITRAEFAKIVAAAFNEQLIDVDTVVTTSSAYNMIIQSIQKIKGDKLTFVRNLFEKLKLIDDDVFLKKFKVQKDVFIKTLADKVLLPMLNQ